MTRAKATGKSGADWLRTERVAGLIERALAPEASVRHDVRLRELTSGTYRQCDIVVTSGPPLRRTITIVEVQKRGRRVEIGMLDAWIKKRDELGAHQLICVSSHEYGKALQRRAVNDGRVRLVTLRRLEQAHWPVSLGSPYIDFSHRAVSSVERVTVTEIVDEEQSDAPLLQLGSIASDDRVFEREGVDGYLTLAELVTEEFADLVDAAPSANGDHAMSFAKAEAGLFVHFEKRRLRVEVGGVVVVTVFRGNVPIEISSYEQRDSAAPDAWLLSATAECGQHRYDLDIVMQRGDAGAVKLSVVGVHGLERGDRFSVGVANPRTGP